MELEGINHEFIVDYRWASQNIKLNFKLSKGDFVSPYFLEHLESEDEKFKRINQDFKDLGKSFYVDWVVVQNTNLIRAYIISDYGKE